MKRVLEKYDEIMNIVLPTLRSERRKTYSPFLPICPDTGKVLEIPVLEILSQKLIEKTKTEKLVMNELKCLDENLTIIMVAHRLTTLKECDLIIELKDGEIKSQGTYSEIVK